MLDIYRTGNPKVTVVMATYDRGEYLQRSIDSYLAQTYRDSELLVVDDGSRDDTFSIVSRYIDQHRNIRYMRHANRKLSMTRNAGIQAAAGEYIAFLDSDDEYKPDYLERRVDFMDAHPEVDLIEGGVIIIGDPYVKDWSNTAQKIHLSRCHVGATFFGKAEVFRALGGFDKNILYAEDSQFWKRAVELLCLQKVDFTGYVYYRNTEGSICNTI